ncbi:MAG: hypothetical protein QM770_05840 [Tepidisphaeraceae bacterium]
MKPWLITTVASVVFVGALVGIKFAAADAAKRDPELTPQAAAPARPTPEASNGKKYTAPPEMKIDVNKTYTATIDTNRGTIVLSLFAKDAPKTVNSFVFLAREVLRRRHLPPRDSGLHDPGRRPHRHRPWWAGV